MQATHWQVFEPQQLPTDRPRAADALSLRRSERYTLAEAAWRGVLGHRQLPAEVGLLAGFVLLLARLSGRQEVSVGVGGGLLTLCLDDDPGYEPLLERVAEALGALQPAPAMAVPELTMALHFAEGELQCDIGHDGALHDAATIARWCSHFETLLAGIAADPQRPASALPLLDAGQRHTLLHDWNRSAADYPGACLPQLIEAQVRRTPEAIAAVFGTRRLAYAELNRRANRLAHRLRALGAGRDRCVGVCLPRGLELPVALLAVLKAGAAYLPLAPDAPAERLAFMLADSAAAIVLTDEALRASLFADPRFAGLDCLAVDAPQAADAPAHDPEPGAGPGDLAYVIYTSGSTGRPKGVMIEHGGLVNNIAWQIREFGFDARDRVLQWTTSVFDAAVWELWTPLCVGATQVIASAEQAADPRETLRLIHAEAVSFAQTVPSFFALLLEELAQDRTPLPLRLFAVGGEALHASHAAAWACLTGVELVNMYGPTECTVDASFHRARTAPAPDAGIVTIGRPIANTRIYIVDGQMQPVPIGVSGEILIASAGIARGYLNQPELTAQRFVPDPFSAQPGARLYRSGDLGRYLPDGSIQFLGRSDHQVKLRGYRIELGEIDAALRRCDGVRQAAVIAEQNAAGEPRLVAYVEPAELSAAALREQLAAQLPAYMLPAAFVALPALPLLANGKLDRRALPAPPDASSAPLAAGAAPPSGGAAPRGELERWLASLWCELLGRDAAGRHDHFFDLGGHSLLAVRLVARVRAATQLDLPLRALFDAPTIAGLAADLEARLQAGRRTGPGLAPDGMLPIPPRPSAGPAPASHAQQALWFLDRMQGRSEAYNVVQTFRLHGSLDPQALERALQALVARHAALRTRFAEQDGVPVQVVEPRIELALAHIDAGDGDAPTRLERLLDDAAAHRFDLAQAPLLRAQLLRVAPDEHVLQLVLHHIVTDGWSMALIARELGLLYAAPAAGLAPLPLQFADYAAWQREQLQGERLARHVGYWRERLAGLQPLDLPTDRPRAAQPGQRGASERFMLPAALAERLHAVARRENATLFMLLLAAFQALLARYTGQHDIAVGTPVAGRDRPELEGLVGDFVNSVVLRGDLSGNPRFSELLARVRDGALGAWSHQALPFDVLVAELGVARERGRHPLFQVFFALQTQPAETLELPGIRSVAIERDGAAAKFDLSLTLTRTPDGLQAVLEYACDLFDRASARRIAAHYGNLLAAVAADASQRLAALPMLGEVELAQLLFAWNDTAAAYPRERCVHELFEAQAARTPAAVALRSGAQSLSYADLDQAANRLAHALRARGAGRGARVGLALSRGPGMLIGLLAVLKSGAAYVPLDPSYPVDRLAFMAEDAALAVLVGEAALAGRLDWPAGRTLLIDRDAALIAAEPAWAPESGARPEDAAYVIYTSGSTGQPKGVVVPHRGAVNFLASMAREPGLAAHDRVLAVTTLSFDIAVLELLLPLSVGACVVLASREQAADASALRRLLESSGATLMQATPATWRLLIEAGWQGGPGLRALIGGEALAPDLARLLLDRCDELWNMYGPTETTVWSTCCRVVDPAQGISIGRPIANTRVLILDADGNLCPPGVPGEIHIGGDGVTLGYLNRPALTAERFVPDPHDSAPQARQYRTGDRGRWRHDGQLEHLGRLDFQVKVRGYRIELGEIEACLALHPQVAQNVVTIREDRPGDVRIVAYVVPSGTAFDADALRGHLAAALPEHMLPQHLVPIAGIPLLPNGKTDRKALPAPEAGGGAGYEAPQPGAEATLAALWAEVLGAARVGATDDFFALGGHSLLALRLMHRIEQAFGRPLRLAALFEAPTVRRLAVLLAQGGDADAAGCTVAIRAEGERPPLFFVSGRGGALLGLGALAQALPARQPLYVLDTTVFGTPQRPAESLPSVAAGMIRDLRRIQPDGPYQLCGFSMGGAIVYEIAQQLRQAGQVVSLLVLMDCDAPGYPLRRGWLGRLAMHLRRMASQRLAANVDHVLERLRYYWRHRGGRDPALFEHEGDVAATRLARELQASADAMTRAWEAYTPTSYPGDALVIRAEVRDFQAGVIDEDPCLGWGRMVHGRVIPRDMDCRHMDMLLPAHAPALAGILAGHLERGQPALPTPQAAPRRSRSKAASDSGFVPVE